MFLLDARAVLGAFAKGRSSVPSLSSALFEKRQLFKWLETGWCDGSTSHLNETQPTHLPEVFTKGLTASVYHRTSTRRCQNRLPSQIGVGIISVHVYAEKVLLCRHLGQPREVHHVVFNERSGTDGRWKCAPASPRNGALCLTCQASRLLPSAANVRKRGRRRQNTWRDRPTCCSDSGVLCSGCLSTQGRDQPSDTAMHQNSCHSMFVAKVIKCAQYLLEQTCLTHGMERRIVVNFSTC